MTQPPTGEPIRRATIFMAGPDSADLRARLLGARLRERREAADLSQADVAKQMRRAHSTLTRWEDGTRIPRPPELAFMLDLYGVSASERDAVLRFAAEAHEALKHDDHDSAAVTDYTWLETRAHKAEVYQDTVVPGLLQTPDYARELLKVWDPNITRDRMERTVAIRMARQHRLTDEHPVELSVVLGEGALRQVVGGPDAMRAQLRQLLDRAALPNIDLRLVPFNAGAHAGLPGPFTILRFRDNRDLAWVLTRGGDIYFADPEPFSHAMRRIKAVALPHKKSVAMIAAMTREIP